MLSMCTGAAVSQAGEARMRLLVMTGGLAVIASSFVVLSLAGSPYAFRLPPMFFWGILGFQLMANVMNQARGHRSR